MKMEKRLSAQFVDDMMEGNSKGWFPSGQQQFDYNFQNNLEHGVCSEWNEQGEKISEIRFDQGVPAQDLLTGQRIILPEPVKKEQTQTTLEKPESTIEKQGLDKVELPPVPKVEKSDAIIPEAPARPEPVEKKTKPRPISLRLKRESARSQIDNPTPANTSRLARTCTSGSTCSGRT